jgi:hypothetical protein
MTDQTKWGIPELQTANRAKKYETDKLKRLEATIDMVTMWLDSNIDDNDPKDKLAQDSADLKQKIELALDSSTSVLDIKNGDL